MSTWKKVLLTVLAAAAILVPSAPPASANHNSCAFHDVPAVATGTVSSTNTSDWWSHDSTIPVTSFTLTMSGGDADLYVYGPNSCSTLACSSVAGGTATDSCPMEIGTGRYYIRVAWYSGTPSYTLTVTHP